MAAVMWIEVLARDGDVRARQRVDSEEARVGRAFDNDVVVDDPHVAPHHVRIFRGDDGRLVAEDLGTLNGLYAEHGARRVPRLTLDGNQPGFRIGRTTLRVHDGAHAVAPEKALTPPRAHAKWDVVLTLVLFLLILFLNWLNMTTEASANIVLLPMLSLATALAMWTGLWAVLSRVFHGQAQFALHLRIAATACIAIVLWDLLTETLSFSFAWRTIADHAALGAWAILGATIYAHLAAIGPRHMKLVVSVVMALVASGAAMQAVTKSEMRETLGQRASLGDLRPPMFRMVPLATADEFFSEAAETRARVDRARTKEPPQGGSVGDFD